MSSPEDIKQHEARAEAAYAAMYDTAPHNVKDCYEDACLNLKYAIETALGLEQEAARLGERGRQIDAVYNSQFRYAGR